MAIFNPELPPSNPDFTRNSQGYRGDSSLGGLFEDVGNLFGQAVKAKDQLFKEIIRADATAGVDQLRDREINQGAQQQGYGIPAGDKAAIDQGASRAGMAGKANRTGQIGDSHYQLLLDAEARRLRARYPGHREYIDNVISDLTGGTPANKAIELMKQEGKSTDVKEKERLHQIHWAQNPEHGGGALANHIATHGHADNVSLEQMYKWNGEQTLLLAKQKQRDSTLNTEDKERKGELARKLPEITGDFMKGVENIIKGVSETSGVNWKNINQTLADIDIQNVQFKPVTPEQDSRLRAQISQFTSRRLEEFDKYVNAPRKDTAGKDFTYAGFMGSEELGKFKQRVVDQIDNYIKPILDNDYGALARNAMYVKASENEAASRLLKSSEFLRNSQGFRKIMGDQTNSMLLSGISGAMPAVSLVYRNHVIMSMAGDKPIKQVFDEIKPSMDQAGMSPEEQSRMKRDAMNVIIQGLQSKTTPTGFVENTMTKLFSGDPRYNDFYAEAAKQSTHDANVLYQKLINPAMADAALNSPNQVVRDNYKNWVNKAVNKNFNDIGDTIKSVVMQGDTGYTIRFNPSNLQFSADSTGFNRPQSGSARVGPTRESEGRTVREDIVDRLNMSVRHWRPVANKLGITDQQIPAVITNLLKDKGIDINNMNSQVKPEFRRPGQ